jgi:hypothetical protein
LPARVPTARVERVTTSFAGSRGIDPRRELGIDGIVAGMMKSGEMEKRYNRWLMAPIPPKNIVINDPLNANTRDAFANPSSKGI